MKKNQRSKVFLFFLLLFFLLGVNPVRNIVSNGAGFVFALEINYPKIPGATSPQVIETLPPEERLPLYVQYIFNFVIWLGGAIALIGLIYGGVRYLISTGKPEAIVSAKDQIVSAFFGLLLLLSSFLILKILSPQFVVLKIPELKPIEIPEKKEIPFPEEEIKTSIDAEMPFSRIIEGKIFESYISEWPEPEEKREPRMKRIKENAKITKKLADKLKEQNEELKEAAEGCECSKADPCCKHPNPGVGCTDNSCTSKPGCTCDPCEGKPREDIKKFQEENIKALYSGIEIEISKNDKTEEKTKIVTNLTEQMEKTVAEVKELKIELDRLERGAKYIEECPLRVLNSFSQFLQKKDFYESSKDPKAQNVAAREIKFWDDISIVYKPYDYLKNKEKEKPDNDFAIFYCTVGGTVEQEPFFPPKPEEYGKELTGDEPEEKAERILKELAEKEEEVLTEEMACSDEAPVGEIIDRTLRTGNLLVKKMEKLIEEDKKMIKAVDEMHRLVSQCSSQRCYSYCFKILKVVCIKRCGDSSLYPEGPCPKSEIEKKLKEIQEIQKKIEHLVECKCKEGGEEGEEETPEQKKENAGILYIIDEIVPEILKDLDWYVRIPMKYCVSESFESQDIVLFNCLESKGATTPEEGRVIGLCCVTEQWKDGEKKQTVYGDCFEECFLEKGVEKHRECVWECLARKSQELKDKELPLCFHRLNFYCCHAKR